MIILELILTMFKDYCNQYYYYIPRNNCQLMRSILKNYCLLIQNYLKCILKVQWLLYSLIYFELQWMVEWIWNNFKKICSFIAFHITILTWSQDESKLTRLVTKKKNSYLNCLRKSVLNNIKYISSIIYFCMLWLLIN